MATYSRVRASGFGVGLAVPALHHLRARGAEAEDEPPTGQVVEGHRRHRRGRRSASRHLGDGGAELDPLGVRAPPGQRHQGVGAVGLGRPDRVEPEPFGLQDRGQPLRRRSRPPVPRVQPKLHDRTVPRRLRSPAVPRAGEVRYRAAGADRAQDRDQAGRPSRAADVVARALRARRLRRSRGGRAAALAVAAGGAAIPVLGGPAPVAAQAVVAEPLRAGHAGAPRRHPSRLRHLAGWPARGTGADTHDGRHRSGRGGRARRRDRGRARRGRHRYAGGPAFLTVWPADQPRPDASNINADGAGATVADLVTTRLSSTGTGGDLLERRHRHRRRPLRLLRAGRRRGHRRAHAARRPDPGLRQPPRRRRLHAGQTRIDRSCRPSVVPAGASAAVVNLTVTGTLGAGFWSIYPDRRRPRARWPARDLEPQRLPGGGDPRRPGHRARRRRPDRPRLLVRGRARDRRRLRLHHRAQSTPAGTNGLFVPLPSPVRFADTRTATNNPLGPLPEALYPGWTMEVPILGRGGVPAAASLVAATTTYVQATDAGLPHGVPGRHAPARTRPR